jgi:hypothetical protein
MLLTFSGNISAFPRSRDVDPQSVGARRESHRQDNSLESMMSTDFLTLKLKRGV